jgi:alpha-beta hydrolase superfamily lysophospholipase
MSGDTLRRAGLALAALLLGACASVEAPVPAEPAPLAVACPKGVPDGARCLRGRDSVGAHVLIVVPQAWSGVLVVHAHGGPTLGEPKAERADEDIARWAITVRAGHAWAASVFRQGGVAVRSAAEDTERVRRMFVQHVATPRRTLLHGQSWGAGVAAKAAELYPRSWDGVLLTSGVLAGGSRSYAFRLDLRAVYQVLCNNHPKPDEPAYPLWMGLPPDAKLTRAELAARVDDCLGTKLPAAQRTPAQAQRLKTIVDVIRIPPGSVLAHLNWATWHFQDIAQNRTGGANPFDNHRVRYTGSTDDDALNAAVPRWRADPAAAARFAADTDPTGRIDVPVLTTHGIGDATAFVELQSAFRQTMEAAGRGERLVQTFVDASEHSHLGDATYPPLFDALLAWIDAGRKPTPQDIAARCAAQAERWGGACRFRPDYRPAPLETRVAAR